MRAEELLLATQLEGVESAVGDGEEESEDQDEQDLIDEDDEEERLELEDAEGKVGWDAVYVKAGEEQEELQQYITWVEEQKDSNLWVNVDIVDYHSLAGFMIRTMRRPKQNWKGDEAGGRIGQSHIRKLFWLAIRIWKSQLLRDPSLDLTHPLDFGHCHAVTRNFMIQATKNTLEGNIEGKDALDLSIGTGLNAMTREEHKLISILFLSTKQLITSLKGHLLWVLQKACAVRGNDIWEIRLLPRWTKQVLIDGKWIDCGLLIQTGGKVKAKGLSEKSHARLHTFIPNWVTLDCPVFGASMWYTLVLMDLGLETFNLRAKGKGKGNGKGRRNWW